MSLVVPNGAEVRNLELFLNQALVLKLYSNDIIPSETDTFGTYNEISGGGYVMKSLPFVGWTITPGAPTVALFATQEFLFTGPTDAPGTVYGYFVVANDGLLLWAERFSESVLPFTPLNGSLISVTPRFEAS